MKNLHPLLKRQLKKLAISESETEEKINKLLVKVSDTYSQLYSHIELKDNVLEVEDREYSKIVAELKDFNEKLGHMVEEKTMQLFAKEKTIENQKLIALGEISAGIAHEINNPLTIIMGLSGLLKRQLGTENFNVHDMIEKIDRINQVSMRISKIIEGIRSFARQTDEGDLIQVSFAKIINDTLVLCSEKLRTNGIELIFDERDFDYRIKVRAIQISQIILNLINNAIDILENNPIKKIELKAEKSDQFFILKVIDSGPGIPENVRSKIMQPFFTTKEVGRGTGLGLSISLGIARAHGGDLVLNAKSPQTCFELKLPLFTDSFSSAI